MFVHSGYFHIATNVFGQVDLFMIGSLTIFLIDLSQLFLGLPLQKMHSWWRIMLIYLAGGLAGSLTGILAIPDGFHTGASSGVSALSTAHLANALFNWQEMNFPAWIYILFAGCSVLENGVIVYYKSVEN